MYFTQTPFTRRFTDFVLSINFYTNIFLESGIRWWLIQNQLLGMRRFGEFLVNIVLRISYQYVLFIILTHISGPYRSCPRLIPSVEQVFPVLSRPLFIPTVSPFSIGFTAWRENKTLFYVAMIGFSSPKECHSFLASFIISTLWLDEPQRAWLV